MNNISEFVASSLKERGRSDLASLVLAAHQSVTMRSYPVNVNEKAKATWEYVIDTYRDQIKSAENSLDQWKIALILFKRACTQRGIQPFNTENPFAEVIESKLIEDYKNVTARLNDIMDALKQEGLVSSIEGARYYETALYQGRYYSSVQRAIKLPKGSLPLLVLTKLKCLYGFNTGLGWARYKFNSNTDILIEEENGKLSAYITMYLTPEQALALTGNSANITSDELLKEVSKSSKRWLRTGSFQL